MLPAKSACSCVIDFTIDGLIVNEPTFGPPKVCQFCYPCVDAQR